MALQYDADLVSKYTSDAKRSHPLNIVPYTSWLHYLGDIKDKNILDLACGDGYSSRFLQKRGAKVLGVDISPAQIMRAKELERASPLGISYLLADVQDLNLGKTFDIVTPTFLFNYAETKEQLAMLIEKAFLHLRPGGVMAALTTSPQAVCARVPGSNHSAAWEGPPYQDGSAIRMKAFDIHENLLCEFTYFYWSQETYKELFARSGFINIRWRPLFLPPELRSQFPNWQELEEQNASALVLADVLP
jgi:SAM-dependent methyltransferase